ncbi:MAG: pseudouridine-5'-phosphate glycosidase [Streptosporangiaceae bacterium]|jgi:pseudouridine-5'-phosphate glycosidase
MPDLPVLSQKVRDALAAGRPVVALESTIITHGLPRPANLAAAREFETMLDDAGVVPATIGVIDGLPKVGLTPSDLERIAVDVDVIKVSSRELGMAIAGGRTAGTTVAATSVLAAKAGIRVFATGGLGGVHRGAAASFDESADLTVLSRTPITLVSAGVKSILDIAATLERLETLGVPVVGFRTNRFPAFYLTDSGHDIDWRADSAAEIAAIMAARDQLGDRAALLVANPVPPDAQLDPRLHDRVLSDALAAAGEVRGKDVTPFLLDYFHSKTAGRSLAVNLDLVRNNIRLAAEIARAFTG